MASSGIERKAALIWLRVSSSLARLSQRVSISARRSVCTSVITSKLFEIFKGIAIILEIVDFFQTTNRLFIWIFGLVRMCRELFSFSDFVWVTTYVILLSKRRLFEVLIRWVALLLLCILYLESRLRIDAESELQTLAYNNCGAFRALHLFFETRTNTSDCGVFLLFYEWGPRRCIRSIATISLLDFNDTIFFCPSIIDNADAY